MDANYNIMNGGPVGAAPIGDILSSLAINDADVEDALDQAADDVTAKLSEMDAMKDKMGDEVGFYLAYHRSARVDVTEEMLALHRDGGSADDDDLRAALLRFGSILTQVDTFDEVLHTWMLKYMHMGKATVAQLNKALDNLDDDELHPDDVVNDARRAIVAADESIVKMQEALHWIDRRDLRSRVRIELYKEDVYPSDDSDNEIDDDSSYEDDSDDESFDADDSGIGADDDSSDYEGSSDDEEESVD
ncbi:hypothetical protein CTRI78_v011314 [Colletotrichum trifolii]|uniref:Uncharacterized protein n=1 Tax=Colletotrichum trifolii TaxID=5466 RepID=A0A4R8QJN4_COLTR|nr:hypothetical protein CTRI78_v011314 [Colletotrichum trifolii]